MRDIEFKSLIPKLDCNEYTQLEKNIIKNGCLDSLKVWGNIIIDGHNRYNICQNNNIEFNTDILEFLNEDDVKIWIIDNQLGKRNITDYVKYELIKEKENIVI